MYEDIIRQTLSESFKGKIWRIETDEDAGLMALETRDVENHSTGFSVLNYETGKCYFKDIAIQTGWWYGLEKIHQNMLFIHGYAGENSPVHKGITAIDAFTGEIVWQQFNTAIEYMSDKGLITYNTLIQPKKLTLLSPRTGEKLQAGLPCLPLNNTIKLPVVFPGVNKLPDLIPPDTAGEIMYTQLNDKICWSFHVRTGNGYKQQLVVTAGDKVLLNDILSDNIQKLNPEAFFVQRGYLHYVKNKVEIVSYLL